MRDLQMPGDKNLRINFNNYVASSMRVREAVERLDDLEEDTKASTPVIVSNVGTCDFNYEQETDIVALLGEYIEFIEEVQYQCPSATLIVSSVLPRSGKGAPDEKACEELNERILSFNNLLNKHCDKTKNVYFVDNYLFTMDSAWKPRQGLYWDDVHLNKAGKEKLSDSLFSVIASVYFRARICKELLEAQP